jgi:hypothetical protein
VQKAATCSSLSHGGFWRSAVFFFFFFFLFFLMKCCVFCDHKFFSQNWAYLFFFNEKSAKNRVRSLSIGRGSQETLSRAA